MKKQLVALGLIACLSVAGSMIAFAGTSRVKMFMVSASNTDGGKISAVGQTVPKGHMPRLFPENKEVFVIYRLPSSISGDSMGFKEYAIHSNGADTQNPPTKKTASWANDGKGWWIQYSDGTYLTNNWYQSPESGLWYYMGSDGYMLTDATSPDGYHVNADGVYIADTQEKSLEAWKEEFRAKWEAAYKKASLDEYIPNFLGPIKYTFSIEYFDEITGDLVKELCENCARTKTYPRNTYYWYNYSSKKDVLTVTAVNSPVPIPDSMMTVE